jgi:hypothetical protein
MEIPMTTLTRNKAKPAYQKILEAARDLSLADQRRLRDELANMVGVQLVRPAATPAAVRRGRRLAKAVRVELAKSVTGSLDEAMRSLRGRSWS